MFLSPHLKCLSPHVAIGDKVCKRWSKWNDKSNSQKHVFQFIIFKKLLAVSLASCKRNFVNLINAIENIHNRFLFWCDNIDNIKCLLSSKIAIAENCKKMPTFCLSKLMCTGAGYAFSPNEYSLSEDSPNE